MTAARHQPSQSDGYLDCHDEAGADQRRTDVKAAIDTRLAALAPIFDGDSD